MGYDRRVQMSIYVATDCMCYMRLSVCLPGFVAWAWAWIRFYQPRMHLSNGITVPRTNSVENHQRHDTYFEFKATSILSKSVISRKRKHHALGGAESFTFLPLLFVRSAHLASAERGREMARRQPTLGRHHNDEYHTAASLAHAYEYDMTVSRYLRRYRYHGSRPVSSWYLLTSASSSRLDRPPSLTLISISICHLDISIDPLAHLYVRVRTYNRSKRLFVDRTFMPLSLSQFSTTCAVGKSVRLLVPSSHSHWWLDIAAPHSPLAISTPSLA